MGRGKAWTESEDADLLRLLAHSVDYKAAAHILDRSVMAIRVQAHRLRRHPPVQRPIANREPVSQAGPIAIVEARDRDILARSLSTQSQAHSETPPSMAKPATPPGEAVQARIVINPYTGELGLQRVDAGSVEYPSPRQAMHSPLGWLSLMLRGPRKPPT